VNWEGMGRDSGHGNGKGSSDDFMTKVLLLEKMERRLQFGCVY
jgi:hypothetical protein